MKMFFKKYSLAVGVFCAAHIAILSRLKFFPYPELFIYSYLTKSGLIPYRQIFDQHFPGLMFFPINFASLGIDTVAEMRFVSYFLVVLSHIAIYKISKEIIKDARLLLIPNLLFLIWHPFVEGYVLWIDNFAQTTLLWSFYFLLFKSRKAKFLTGLFLGLTLLLKQTVAPLVLLLSAYLFISTKSKKALLPVVWGFMICVFLLLAWVYKLGIWKDFYYWTFIFNVTTFAQMGRKLPNLVEAIKVIPAVGVPLAFLLLPFSGIKITRNLILLLIFYAGSLFFAFARFDYVHLQPALPFSILIIVYIAKALKPKFGFISKLLLTYVIFSFFLNIYLIRTFVGKSTYFFGEFEEKLASKVNLRRGGKVFAFGTTPHIYYLTETIPPGKVFVFQFPWFMKVAEEKVYSGLVDDPPEVVIRDRSAQVSGMNLVKYMPTISEYVGRYYRTVETIGETEVMVRN